MLLIKWGHSVCTCCLYMEMSEMNILIKVFLVMYLLAMVLATILSVVWILTAVFAPEWQAKKSLSLKFQKHKRA